MGITYRLGRTLYVALTSECTTTSLIASRGPGFVMPAASGFVPLQHAPSVGEVIDAVNAALSAEPADAVAFAGAGEPLLALHSLEKVAASVSLPMRLISNGLVEKDRAASTATRLVTAGLGSASIALASADAEQYDELMRPEPLRLSPVYSLRLGHAEVCNFVECCVAAGLEVECTAVARDGVDLDAAARLATALGASFRSRSWVPE